MQVKGIPFLAFDAGGVLELFDHHQYPDNIVWDPTAEGLSQRIAEVSAGLCTALAVQCTCCVLFHTLDIDCGGRAPHSKC